MLTPEEQQELKQLEAELGQQGQLSKPVPLQPQVGGLTPEEQQELQQLESELMAHRQAETSRQPTLSEALGAVSENIQNENQQYDQMQQAPEADLGLLNRTRYSVEPIESNRRALLQQQFGAENVIEGPKGELYLRQDGEIRPVNKSGISAADFAELAGTIPEMTGAGFGAVLGGGAASVPAAMAGGAAGSAIRQGASALLGTPQVADNVERAVDLGISTLLAGGGTYAGKKIKPIIKKGVGKYFPKATFSKEGKNLARIAKKEGLKKPTFGQMVGGEVRDEERILERIPIVGRKIKKRVAEQEEKILKNLKSKIGDFEDLDSAKFEAGEGIKGFALEKRQAIKEGASELFEKVSEQGKDVFIEADQLKKSFIESIGPFGLFDQKGKKLGFNPELEISQGEFKRLQNALEPIINAFSRGKPIPGGKKGLATGKEKKYLNATALNAFRKTIMSEITEAEGQGYSNRFLRGIKNKYEDVIEDMLASKNKDLATDWKTARSLWAKQLRLRDMIEKGGKKGINLGSMSNENVVKTAMTNTENLKKLRELTDDETVKKAGRQFIFDVFKKKSGSNKSIRPEAIFSELKNKRDVLTRAIGKEEYESIMDNLTFMAEGKVNLNPSSTFWTELKSNPMTAIATAIGSTAKTGGALELRKAAYNTPKLIDKYTRRSVQTIGQDAKTGAGFGARKLFADDGKNKKTRNVANERK